MSIDVLAGKRPSQSDLLDMVPEEPCPLEEFDMVCGQIFYNSQTLYLKFQCNLCGNVFINISSFCNHLNEHINDGSPDDVLVKVEAGNEQLEHEHESPPAMEAIKIEDDEEVHAEEVDISGDVVEDIDETAEILAEIKEEMMDYEQEDYAVERDDCEDFTDDEDEEVLPAQFEPVENVSEALSFQDYFEKASVLKEISNESVAKESYPPTSSISIPSEPSAPRPAATKRKRVTTVKIIASKNKIAELYKLIETKEKRQTEKLLKDLVTPAEESGPTNEEEELKDSEVTRRPQIVRKLVGETLITHIPKGSVTQSTSDKYSCPACGDVFMSSFSLSIHKRTHYLDTDNRIKLAHKCSECNKLFNRLSEMKDHIVQFHYPDGFQCKICMKKLTSLTLLEGHIERVHLNRPFNCKICNKNFEDSELYDAHVASHDGDKIFKCHICGRRYSSEKMLKLHLERHKEQIPQCCVVCGKMTLRIVQHMKIHTPRPKSVISCNICSKTFNHSSGLSQHRKMWHKNAPSARKAKAGRRRRSTRNAKNAKHSECRVEVQPEDVYQKEEEAKRVIVEMIQNTDYTCYNLDNDDDVIPPMAREETISAVNSITSD